MARQHVSVCPARHLPRPDYPCVCLQVEEALRGHRERRWPYVLLWLGLLLYLAAGAYSVLAILGYVPAAPWSAVG